MQLTRMLLRVLSAVFAPALMVLVGAATAATLPEERADLLFHYYVGGGLTVEGPALQVRKNFREVASLRGGMYVDDISGASIDVVTSATSYTEQRTEYNVGADYLYRDTLMSASYTSSSENDYDAESFDLDVAHDFFGGMSTLTMGYSAGDDQVGRVDTDFSESRERSSWRIGLTQVLTPTVLATANYESIADEGYLQNPYRSARVLGASVPEVYPSTLSSNAVGLRVMKLWKPWMSTGLSYRWYSDSWQVSAHTLQFDYSQSMLGGMLFDFKARYYAQDAASFYSDNFAQPMTYMARDKELSTFSSYALGTRLTLPFRLSYFNWLRRTAISVSTDYVRFDYDDFTDLRTGDPYSFDAAIVQVNFTAFY